MAERKRVGYGSPPIEHRFKLGNQAASKRGSGGKVTKSKALALPEILDRALRTKRKVKRNGEVHSLLVAEILGERLVQMLISGNARDVTLVMQLVEKYLPEALNRTAEVLEVIHHRAETSSIAPPPDELWDEPQR